MLILNNRGARSFARKFAGLISSHAKTTKSKKVSVSDRLKDLREGGSIEIVNHVADSRVLTLLRFGGTLAKLPSTTNNRMITVPRQHIIKKILNMLNDAAWRRSDVLRGLLDDVKHLRGYLTKNEEQKTRLRVMTEKIKELNSREVVPAFPFAADERGFVIVLMGKACNRSDTHNMPKALCDWMEEVKIITNDRYVDVFARRKSDMEIESDFTDVLIGYYSVHVDVLAQKQIPDLINDIFSNVLCLSGETIQ